MDNIPAEADKTYKMTITIRGTVDGKMHSKMGDWDTSHSSRTCPSFYISTEWQDIEVSYTPELENNFLLLQCGDYVGDIYIKYIKFEGYTNVATIPLTQQERHDTLVYAMDKWIKGMMDACQGKVKAWDLINEAISGGGDDGNGNYVLQHSDSYNSGTWDVGGDAFYWQDHMGDLEYVRQACRLARKYGPEDIVLFINDYNLESSWDDNKKLKSLINWIKKWESDGVTRIDGIGTQMHISYYEKSSTQTRKKSAITNMFTLMAATGKYVRVSEMDMGYIDSDGNSVPTGSITEAQHKSMADFYEWIIKEYLRIVPPAQQWGICQWCVTDSKTDSGWRKNTPVGIWDINYYRKHAYAGFVRGLGGVSSGVEGVAQDKDSPKAIYNLFGQRLSAKSPDELPAGMYIIDNRKVVVR
jgi:GH35 family endo-1,4-beta-xylanase